MFATFPLVSTLTSKGSIALRAGRANARRCFGRYVGSRLEIHLKGKGYIKAILFMALMACSSLASALEVDISKMQSAEMKTVDWMGYPVHIYKRSAEQTDKLQKLSFKTNFEAFLHVITHNAKTSGNKYASLLFESKSLESTSLRSYDKEYLVVMGVTPYRGCLVSLSKDKSGFYDPCNNEHYNLAGRITEKKVGLGYHLLIPPHSISGNKIVLREDGEITDFSPDILSMPIEDGAKLLEAIQWGKEDIAKTLIQKTPSVVNYETKIGATALHLASYRGSVELVSMLIKAGFNVNKLTKEGMGPIHFALLADNKNVELLAKHGALFEDYCIANVCVPDINEYLKRSWPDLSEDEINKDINGLRSIQKSHNKGLNLTPGGAN